MHDAFGLRATLLFDLAPGEYHTNVVLAVLSGRAALVCPGGFADQAAVEAIAGLYAPPVAMLSPAEHRSAEHTSELQSLMRNSYAVFCLKKKQYADIDLQLPSYTTQ